jgi:signal recognition particle subunit SRP54
MEILTIKERLQGNSYPGRGIITGLSSDGEKAVFAYFIMGRSVNSRNRVFVKTEDGIETKAFDEKLGVTGVILTKLDGDTRGGAALSIKAVTGKPIKFSGIGEKLSDIEPFHPDRMAGRILGMGDVLTLIDKAAEAFDQQDAEKFARKGLGNKLTLEDFLEQMQSMKKMGGLRSMLSMLPGMSGKDIDVDDNAMKKLAWY